ncbi:MAG: hypothetical protein HF962_02150 [Sulfurovum sp.]|nr:hypothetical protein [Sulfurovum sp.]
MESKTLGIYPISWELLQNQIYLEQIVYLDMSREYYWSNDFSPKFYIAQAKAGFMAICESINGEEILLSEMQRSYAALYFKNLHISQKISTVLRRDKPRLHISSDLLEVANEINRYHKNSWMTSRYMEMLISTEAIDPNFKVISAYIKDGHKMIAGEIGYMIGCTYSSLSGFSSKEKRYRNYGKVQMVLLAKYLEKKGFTFWNLGHPYMPYKSTLGASIYTRGQFLNHWQSEISKEILCPLISK